MIDGLEHPHWSKYHDQSLWYKAGSKDGGSAREELVGLGLKLRTVLIRARRSLDYWVRMCQWLAQNKAGFIDEDVDCAGESRENFSE